MNAPLPAPTLENLIAWTRVYWHISERIDADTRLEADLGITGDDGDEFLRDVQKCFGVSLLDTSGGYREAFGLAENEFLFHSEGGPAFWQKAKVHPLTIGEVLDALQRRAKTNFSNSSFE